jgi:hypothetical protein
MGDPQLIMVPETPKNVEMVMNDLATVDHDFLVVLGDLAQNRAHFYKDYKEAVLGRAVRPVLSLAGNGDVGAGLDAYQEATGLPLYYSIYRKGIRFIFLSMVYFTGEHNHICHLGYDQVRWLRKKLKSDTVSTTPVFVIGTPWPELKASVLWGTVAIRSKAVLAKAKPNNRNSRR